MNILYTFPILLCPQTEQNLTGNAELGFGRCSDFTSQWSGVFDLVLGAMRGMNEKLSAWDGNLSAIEFRLWIILILQLVILIMFVVLLWYVKTKVLGLAAEIRRLAQRLGFSPDDYGQILQGNNNALVEEPEGDEVMDQLERELERLQQEVVELRRRLLGQGQPPLARAG